MKETEQNKQRMKEALELAASCKNSVLPNPMVGAVIYIGNKMVGKGFHKGPGKPHGEIEAIRDALKNGCHDFRKASLYVTLEPCCHTNKRTPPCLPVILEKKFKKIFIATSDPQKQVAGKSIRQLRQNGCEVILGLCRNEALELNKIYFKNQKEKRPYVSLKLAMTFDGAIATSSGQSKWITGTESRKRVHQLRSQVCAIGVGKNTVLKDDPSLNIRLEKTARKQKVIIFGSLKNLARYKVAKANGLKNVICLTDKKPLSKQLDSLYKEHQISHLLIEGGALLASEFIKKNMIDDFYLFYGKGFLGGKASKRVGQTWPASSLRSVKNMQPVLSEIIGSDLFVYGHSAASLRG